MDSPSLIFLGFGISNLGAGAGRNWLLLRLLLLCCGFLLKFPPPQPIKRVPDLQRRELPAGKGCGGTKQGFEADTDDGEHDDGSFQEQVY